MGNRTTKNSFKWEDNQKIYEEEKDGSFSLLKEKLCIYQFGSLRKCKILWVALPEKKLFPIAVTEETRLSFLEKRVLPRILNRHADQGDMIVARARIRNRKNKLEFLSQESFYDSLEDDKIQIIEPVLIMDTLFCFCLCDVM